MDVEQHLYEALRGLTAEHTGNIRLARRLNAETKLRLIIMSDDELWELARRTCCPPEWPVEIAYSNHKQRVEELKATAGEWMKHLGKLMAIDGRD
jgi:hypothetical protein